MRRAHLLGGLLVVTAARGLLVLPPGSPLPRPQGCEVSVLTYNILADAHVRKTADGSYAAVPPEHLAWPARGDRILRELLDAQPDVICLQEVRNHLG